MTIWELRLTLVRRLICDYGGPAAFAARTGIAESTLSRCAGKNPVSIIGDRLAKKIEEALGLPRNRLSDFSEPLDFAGKLHRQDVSLPTTTKELIQQLRSHPLAERDAQLLTAIAKRLAE